MATKGHCKRYEFLPDVPDGHCCIRSRMSPVHSGSVDSCHGGRDVSCVNNMNATRTNNVCVDNGKSLSTSGRDTAFSCTDVKDMGGHYNVNSINYTPATNSVCIENPSNVHDMNSRDTINCVEDETPWTHTCAPPDIQQINPESTKTFLALNPIRKSCRSSKSVTFSAEVDVRKGGNILISQKRLTTTNKRSRSSKSVISSTHKTVQNNENFNTIFNNSTKTFYSPPKQISSISTTTPLIQNSTNRKSCSSKSLNLSTPDENETIITTANNSSSKSSNFFNDFNENVPRSDKNIPKRDKNCNRNKNTSKSDNKYNPTTQHKVDGNDSLSDNNKSDLMRYLFKRRRSVEQFNAKVQCLDEAFEDLVHDAIQFM